ncbi:hypothetical protein GCM10010294_52960 [Streptomyces griseoloalbus]|nr:hypothetical protein GCM10010294_52960 [Streptomyces griseoloalbus]
MRTVDEQCVGVVSETDRRPSRGATVLDAGGRTVGTQGLLEAVGARGPACGSRGRAVVPPGGRLP